MTDALNKLIEAAKKAKPTPEHRNSSRRSFVYGTRHLKTTYQREKWLIGSRKASQDKMTGEERDRAIAVRSNLSVITDPQAKAAAEARNGFRQYDAAIGPYTARSIEVRSKLRPSLILDCSGKFACRD